MVKIINHGLKPLSRRIGTGHNVWFSPGEEVEVTDEALIETLKSKKVLGLLQIKDSVGKGNIGGGIRTRSRPPKRLGRSRKARKHLGKSKQAVKEEIKPPKSIIDKIKKPKGLRKARKGKKD